MGKFLSDRFLPSVPRRYIWAFRFGCIEPDKNPATYLKGSFRCQWLRGHNWENTQRYMQRLCSRLEQRRQMRIWDFYALGRLIHYTTDAFTYAHNKAFGKNLQTHRTYEKELQAYFVRYLSSVPDYPVEPHINAMEAIRTSHREYLRSSHGFHTDCRFCVSVCCTVLTLLLTGHTFFITAPGL